MTSAHEVKDITRCSLPRYIYQGENIYMRKPHEAIENAGQNHGKDYEIWIA